MNKVLVSVAALLCVAAAQQKCPAPSEMEGRLFEISTTRTRVAKFSYDSNNLRVRIIEDEAYTDGERDAYDELFLHKEQIGFRLNLRTKKCERFTLTEPFRYIGVPEDAHFDEVRVLGTQAVPGAGLVVDRFEGDTSRGLYAGEWIPAFTETCLPEGGFYYDRTNGYSEHRNYFDLTLSTDPNAFIPPDECLM